MTQLGSQLNHITVGRQDPVLLISFTASTISTRPRLTKRIPTVIISRDLAIKDSKIMASGTNLRKTMKTTTTFTLISVMALLNTTIEDSNNRLVNNRLKIGNNRELTAPTTLIR